MARNVEKSQNVLNRLINAKNAEARPGGTAKRAKRPFLASECDDLPDADRWSAQVVREIGSKVMEIQNAGLGEARLRDLNDEINKLLREKGHWERRIVELGGPDYSKAAPAAGGDAPAEGRLRLGVGVGPGRVPLLRRREAASWGEGALRSAATRGAGAAGAGRPGLEAAAGARDGRRLLRLPRRGRGPRAAEGGGRG